MIFSDIAIIKKTLAWIQDKNVLDFGNRTEIQRGSILVTAELRTSRFELECGEENCIDCHSG